MKLMLTIAHDYLKDIKEATFEDIFNEVVSQQESVWRETFPKLSTKQILDKKRGELFTYLTTDGRFVLVSESKWGLIQNFKFEDIKTLRVSVIENE